MLPRPKPTLLRGLGQSPPTVPPPPLAKSCPVGLKPYVDKLAELREHLDAQIQNSLGELQAENDTLRRRLAELLNDSSQPIAKDPGDVAQELDHAMPFLQNVTPESHWESEETGSKENWRLPVGTYVHVNGLKSRPELNGEPGTLLEFDEDLGRWHVIMRDGSAVSLKPENVSAVDMIRRSYFNRVLQYLRKRQAVTVQKALDDGIAKILASLSQSSGVHDECQIENGNEETWRTSALRSSAITLINAVESEPLDTNKAPSNRVTCMQLITKEQKGRDGKPDKLRTQATREDLDSARSQTSLNKCFFADAGAMRDRVREAIYRKPYNVTDFYYEDGCAQRVARSTAFEQFTLGVIALNAVWIGIDTHFNSATPGAQGTPVQSDTVFVVFDNIFCTYFFFEWLVRFLAFRNKCDGLRDRWFVFDSMLVLFMVLETWVFRCVVAIGSGSISGKSGFFNNMSTLRIVRLLRLTRVARLARLLRAMPELMILVKALSAAFRSVFFTILLLMMLIYVFAIAFVQLTADTYLGDEYFTGVPDAVYTLLLLGNMPDHYPFVTSIVSENFYLGALLFCFIFLGPLAIMGMLAGVLVEVVGVVSSVERERILVNYVTDKLHKMLEAMDLDGNKMLTKAEFQVFLVWPDAARMMASVGVDVVALAEYCDFLFADRVSLTYTAFVDLVLELRGTNQATVKDIVDTRKFMRQELNDLFTNELASLEDRILAKVPQETAFLISRT